jgi:pimeloyl-ACP methyl ester carboxylesterase
MVAPCADAQVASQLQPCAIEGLTATLCGTVSVPENRAAPQGRRISLRVSVLRATGQSRAADPIFALTGGPGQSAVADAVSFAEELAEARIRRDIVLVDQRGTGGSNPLQCRASSGGTDERADREIGDACLRALAPLADVRYYTTLDAALDLEEVRKALGYARVNLHAASYGTRLALVYMREFPLAVRSAVLKGISPPDMAEPLPFPQAGQTALDRLLADCRRDAACAAAFPNLSRRLDATLARLASQPIDVHPESIAAPVRMTRARFTELLHLTLFSPDLSNRIPMALHDAADGRLELFAALAAAMEQAVAAQIAYGLQLAVVCPEDVSRITRPAMERAGRRTFLGTQLIESYLAICAGWPRGRLPDDYWDLPRLDTPALLVSSQYDPSTPVALAIRVAARMPRARHVVMPGATHQSKPACWAAELGAFFEAGSPAAVDRSCLEAPHLRAFVILR